MFITTSCTAPNGGQGHWKYFIGEGLKDSQVDFNSLIFVTEKKGFLFGSTWQDDDILSGDKLRNQKSAIYSTENSGQNWKLNEFSNGSFETAVLCDSVIFAVKKTYYGFNVNDVESSQLIFSGNLGNSWQEKYLFRNDIQKLIFHNSMKGMAIAFNSSLPRIEYLMTISGGNSWNAIDFINKPSNNAEFDKKGFLWYLPGYGNNRNGSKCVVYKDIFGNESETKEDLPEDFVAVKIYIDLESNIWLLGSIDDMISVVKRDKHGKYHVIKNFLSGSIFSPEHIYVCENSVSIVIGETKETSIGYIKFHYFRSDDKGETWHQEAMAVDNRIDPIV